MALAESEFLLRRFCPKRHHRATVF